VLVELKGRNRYVVILCNCSYWLIVVLLWQVMPSVGLLRSCQLIVRQMSCMVHMVVLLVDAVGVVAMVLGAGCCGVHLYVCFAGYVWGWERESYQAEYSYSWVDKRIVTMVKITCLAS